MADGPGVKEQTITEDVPMGDPDLERICVCGHSILSHELLRYCEVEGCECEAYQKPVTDERIEEILEEETAIEETAGLCACGHSIMSHPKGRDCMVDDCECEAFEPAPEDPIEGATEVYRHERPQQLEIPTMTADAKVGLITSQVQQVERLVGIMLEVLAVRRDDGTAPYDLWNKALEPALDAEVLLKGIVQLLKTRNTRRY